MTAPVRSAYIAPEGFVSELADELGGDAEVYDRLVLSAAPAKDAVSAENIWHDPRLIEISSIGDAVQKLKTIQRNWANYAFDFHRRSNFIAEKLPHVSARPLKFPNLPPAAPLGSWTLVRPDLILASPSCSSPVPNGAYLFEENRTDAPSRAYLKLWEALTRLKKFPGAGETCLDLGSSPGGWTWVLQTLGANVVSVDKAELAPGIASLPRIKYVRQSAFALNPADVGPVDWLFSDIICYPEKLLKLVENWKKSGLVRNMVCTIKFQGATDHAALRQFAAIPGSKLFHLYNNKHEVTWTNVELLDNLAPS